MISEGTKVEKRESTKVEKLKGTRVVTKEGLEVLTVPELVDVVGLSTVAKAPRVSITEKITPATVSVKITYLRKQLTKNRAKHEYSDHDESQGSIEPEASLDILAIRRVFRASSGVDHRRLEAI